MKGPRSPARGIGDHENGLDRALARLEGGIEIDGSTIIATPTLGVRSRAERVLDVSLSMDGPQQHLMFVRIYLGLGVHYRPWVEMSGIRAMVPLDDDLHYFGSAAEDVLLTVFSGALGPGGRLFVAYGDDRETERCLSMGFPPPVTRLGHKLFLRGFTWFKDWYFPEGGLEGGQKLQGEQPLDEEARSRHLAYISEAVSEMLKSYPGANGDEAVTSEDAGDIYVLNALKRGRDVQGMVDSSSRS